MTDITASNTNWTELQQVEDMAYFRADLCLYSPESYSLEEKREICNDIMGTSTAILDAMRADFEQLPPEARSKPPPTRSASRGSRRPSGGGMFLWEKAIHCIAKQQAYPYKRDEIAKPSWLR